MQRRRTINIGWNAFNALSTIKFVRHRKDIQVSEAAQRPEINLQ